MNNFYSKYLINNSIAVNTISKPIDKIEQKSCLENSSDSYKSKYFKYKKKYINLKKLYGGAANFDYRFDDKINDLLDLNKYIHLSHIDNRSSIQNNGLQSPLISGNYTGLNELDSEGSNKIHVLLYEMDIAKEFLNIGGYCISKIDDLEKAKEGSDIDVWILDLSPHDVIYDPLNVELDRQIEEYYIEHIDASYKIRPRLATNEERKELGLVEYEL